jgi:hypothetical protein
MVIMRKEETSVKGRQRASKQGSWVTRGVISACECFSCVNKVEHRLNDARVSILCRDPCNYKPKSGGDRPVVTEIDNIERDI